MCACVCIKREIREFELEAINSTREESTKYKQRVIHQKQKKYKQRVTGNMEAVHNYTGASRSYTK